MAAGARLCEGGAVVLQPLFASTTRLASRILVGALLSALAASGCTTNNTVVRGGPTTGGRRDSVPCTSGDTTLPIEAFDINPDPATGNACNVGNVLDDDGKAAALDWSGSGTHTIGGKDVTGCLAAEFGEGITLDSLKMRMRPVGDGCGKPCTPGDGDDACGTGWKIAIFAGPSLDELEWVQQLSLTTADTFEYSIFLYESFKARFVAICREPTPASGDDIAIDALSGTCR